MAVAAMLTASAAAHAEPVVTLNEISLDAMALDNGCSTQTVTADQMEDCRYRVCFNLLRNLWLVEEAKARDIKPDAEVMEQKQREYESSHVGEQLTFTVQPRLRFQRQAIDHYRKQRAANPEYDFADLWADVETSATQVEIPERALNALISTYGSDERGFQEFQKLFPDDYVSAMERSRNDWEREASRVALEKALCPDDELTTGELELAREKWATELDMAPTATEKMLRNQKRQYHVNVHLVRDLREKAKFADEKFRSEFLAWVDDNVMATDAAIFKEK